MQKKAALAVLRLFREASDQLALGTYATNIVQLLTSADKGVVTSVASLLVSAAAKHLEDFASCVAVAANRLHQVCLLPFPAMVPVELLIGFPRLS